MREISLTAGKTFPGGRAICQRSRRKPMSVDLVKKVKKAIIRHRMLADGDAVVVAVSGGPDSVALLSVLNHLSMEYGWKLTVAHMNHGLRPGPAEEDEILVRELSEQFGLVCESEKVDVVALSRMRKTSLEGTAREERYRFLAGVRHRCRASKIALGHHAGDQAETVLMNLLRGSGGEGLRGMQPVREGLYIRPLLDAARSEIAAYLAGEKLPYRIDLTNAEENCLRNTIRGRLLPELKSRYNPRLEENLCRTAEILGVEEDYFDFVVEALIADPCVVDIDAARREIHIDTEGFLRLHEALRRRMIKSLLLRHAGQQQGIGYTHVRDVLALAQHGASGRSLHLPFGMEVRREHGILTLGRRRGPPRASGAAMHKHRKAPADSDVDPVIAHSVDVPGQVRIGAQGALTFDFVTRAAVCFGDARTAYMDYACIAPPLAVRTSQPGDRIQPLGMAGGKKLHRYFIDRKIPEGLRGQIPILVDSRSVIWVVGHMLSERVKITDGTTNILRIALTEFI